MRKKAIFWLAAMLCMLLTLLSACGANGVSSGNPQPGTAQHGSARLYVLDGYTAPGASTTGNQRIIAFQPESAHPGTLVTLPAGLMSFDHQRVYTATAQGGHTSIAIFDTQSGRSIRTFSIPGSYSTSERGYATPVSSPDGRWLALRQQGTASDATTIALVDTQAAKLVKTFRLIGTFTLDAISANGGMIYFLQYPNSGNEHYDVRAFDAQAGQLLPGTIVDKSEINEKMQGTALTRQMAADGSFAYTLYINTAINKAFVHILPLYNDPGGPPLARCLDLPVGHSASLLHYYTLALSADGLTLYAANAALGTAVKIGLDHNQSTVFDINITATGRFNPGNVVTTSSDRTRMLHNGAVLSPDQKTLYIAGERGIWVLDTATLNVRAHYLTQQTFTGVAISADGRTLYAVDPTTGITLVDAAAGQVRQVTKSPAQAPWGIEWITS
ncbi:MAG: hypothetical protein H0W02_00530 [Ktedonobacteraceae bacterium]|nr:hypothetical protein [Ktedonobacteraceae bacterium]